ncbi:MAG: helix-turn-helix domain-containing protein [Planctomycetota bacterium]
MSSVMDQLRAAVDSSDESAYAIAKGSGVDRSQLSRLLSSERDLSMESAERLADYLGLEIVVRPKRSMRRSK